MNDMKISNGNPYLNKVEIQGNGQDVGQVGGTGSGVGTTEKSNLSVVQGGSPSQSGTQSAGVNKHVLDQPYPTTSADLEGANGALASFLEGLKPSADQEDEPVDKTSVLKEKRAKDLKKQEEDQPDLVIHKVMSEASDVNRKVTSTAAQINMQANNAQWRVAEESARKTGEARNSTWQIVDFCAKMGAQGLSIASSHVSGPSAEKCAGKSVDDIIKLNKATEKTRNILDVGSKISSLLSAGANIFAVSKDADEQVVENHRKQAIQSFIRESGAVAQSFAKSMYDLTDKTSDILDAICVADIEQLRKMRVTAS